MNPTVRNAIQDRVRLNKSGHRVGVYSVCSAHPLVLEAACIQAVEDGSFVLIEATSNQVDQFGGYTGMRPADFRDLVWAIAHKVGLPLDRVVLGGDHLGPNRWRDRSPEQAMELASALVKSYVEAGYAKIHLDCSMSCAGDPVPLGDKIVAHRTARLLRIAEDTASVLGGDHDLVYVIGTEVPVPGGAHETLGELKVTTAEAAAATLMAHEEAFIAQGLNDVWPRVVALVVQPGVEFDHLKVIDYRSDETRDLRRFLDNHPHLAFEAHSTDYQTPDKLRDLVGDHWAVLKVGPALTFALREALFALARIEDQLIPETERSDLIDVVERSMLEQPEYWQGYYEGTVEQQHVARVYSYSDRIRYYWPIASVTEAEERLYRNLSSVELPLPMISQFLPDQYWRVREGNFPLDPRTLVIDHIRDAIRPYVTACAQVAASVFEREGNPVV